MKWLLSLTILLVLTHHTHAQNCSELVKSRTVYLQTQQYKDHSELAPCMAHNRMLYSDDADTLQQLSDFYHDDTAITVQISKPITPKENMTHKDGSTLQREIGLWIVREPNRLYLIGNVTHHDDEYTPHHHCYVTFHFTDGSSITYDEPMYSHYSDAEEIFVLLAGHTNPYQVGDFTYNTKGHRGLYDKLQQVPVKSISRGCSPPSAQPTKMIAYEPTNTYNAVLTKEDANTLMHSLRCITQKK